MASDGVELGARKYVVRLGRRRGPGGALAAGVEDELGQEGAASGWAAARVRISAKPIRPVSAGW